MTLTMHHGTSCGTLPLHEGVCLADDEGPAAEYALSAHGTHLVHTVTLALDGLEVLEVDGYDHDGNTAPGDDGEGYGADVIIFDDETPHQHRHVTYRLMTPAALAAVTVTGTRGAEDI
jgi:hypothetical protein